jgi:hypothetical protein
MKQKLKDLAPLDRLRMGSNPRNRFSISRPAKRVIRPTTYDGTGSVPHLIGNLFPSLPAESKNALLKRVERYADYYGDLPPIESLKSWSKVYYV